MFLAAATRLDRYEVVSLLGTGGMGEVYLVRDTKLDRRVALKLVSAAVAADADRMRRFLGEAKAASALNHPNILVVHEIGESAGRPFIVTEFIEGVTLRQRLVDGRSSLAAALDVAVQVASALAAAHTAGIVHRDIKPENIMIRPDGVVKVLDFGLARVVVQEENSATLVTDPPARAEAATVAWDMTSPGLMLGTTRYMSPEQARGLEVDARSDVFSCGVVLYEMLAGRSPFAGDTISDTIAALLTADPPAIDQYLSDTPHQLQPILDQALAKSRDQRYPSAKELWADLVALRRAVEFGLVPPRDREPKAVTTSASDRRVRRGGTINTLKRHAFAGIAAALLLAIAAVMFRSYSNRPAALTDKDTILIADFVNATGDQAFDAALKQGLAVQLSQSPFLSIFPEARVRETLRLMGRSADDPVTPEVAREIGQRQGLKAFIAGSIRKFDRNYSITLEALASLTGEPLALAQSEAIGRDEVLKALSRAATELRERLGESLSTIEAFDAPLELTTSSLDALQAFALGEQEAHRGDYRSAIAFFQRAVELDPEFAYGWAKLAVHHMNTRQPALAAEFATRAFALRHRVSELERLRMSSFYSFFVDGDVDEGVKLVERYKRIYPRDGLAATNIASGHIALGQFDRAIPEARAALQLTPGQASALGDLAIALLAVGDITEARDVALQAVGQKIDSADLRSVLYFTAFVLGDTTVMQQQLDWAKGRADEHVAFDWQARTAAARGRRDAAEDFTRRAVTLAAQTGAKELAARYTAENALRAAAFGDCPRIRPAVNDALALDRAAVPLTRSALALALCGQADLAQPLLDELRARYPKATLINTLWIPTILAAIEVERGNGDRSMEFLAQIRFEGAGERWPQYVRARALALQRNWSKAEAELNQLVADRGQVPFSPIGGLAHLRLAQVASEMGDMDKAWGHYARLLDYWSDADPKLPVLLRARAAYARLPQ